VGSLVAKGKGCGRQGEPGFTDANYFIRKLFLRDSYLRVRGAIGSAKNNAAEGEIKEGGRGEEKGFAALLVELGHSLLPIGGI